MFRIILTVITLALIATSCNHNHRSRANFHFNYDNIPDYGFGDNNDSIIEDNPAIREIPEPSFLFSYALISVSYVMIKKK